MRRGLYTQGHTEAFTGSIASLKRAPLVCKTILSLCSVLSLSCVLRSDRTKSARQALEARGQRTTSKLRGVTHHLRTSRWEAHVSETQTCGFLSPCLQTRGHVPHTWHMDMPANSVSAPVSGFHLHAVMMAADLAGRQAGVPWQLSKRTKGRYMHSTCTRGSSMQLRTRALTTFASDTALNTAA